MTYSTMVAIEGRRSELECAQKHVCRIFFSSKHVQLQTCQFFDNRLQHEELLWKPNARRQRNVFVQLHTIVRRIVIIA